MTISTIQAIATHLPDRTLDNEELAREFGDWTADKMLEKTGIQSRRVAAEGECASDLGVAAARKLFDSGVCEPRDVDFLIFCTQSPDYFLPSTACLVQERLGLRRDAGAFDINQGCSGFVYGLATAKGLLESGSAKRVLLINADTYTRFLNPRDRSVRTLFGDGAAATLVGLEEGSAPGIGPFVFGTDGSGQGNLIVPAGGMRKPRSEATATVTLDGSGNARSDNDLFMNGPEIFNFTLRVVPETVHRLLAAAGVGPDAIDLFVFHQASAFLLEHLRRKLKIPAEKFVVDLREKGNTVSATIPGALETAARQGRLKRGSRLLLLGFGVGYSWCGAMATVTGEWKWADWNS